MRYQWELIPAPDLEQADFDLAEQLGVSPVLLTLLRQRGLDSPAMISAFLNPGLRHLAALDKWPGLEQAARAIAAAVAEGQKAVVWGDYDVDGVTSVVALTEFMAACGLAMHHHLPDRLGKGYGLNVENVEELAGQGFKLLITVDCGIADVTPVARARELGLTVVVVDHHLPEGRLPDAQAIFNPRLYDDCPGHDLTGVGLTFLLICALNRLLPDAPLDLRPYLDLVALGTLADVADLKGQNRVLVKNGLLIIAQARRPGLAALKEVAGFAANAYLNAEQVSFGLNPRLNAAGRMASAEEAYKLLTAPDLATARPLAEKLDKLNIERKQTEQDILAQAMGQAEASPDQAGLVFHGQDWHPGVLGIVASRLAEVHYRPTLVLSGYGRKEHMTGSGRSIKEVNIFKAISSCAELLTRYGGHRQAAGLSLAVANLEELRQRFDQAVREQMGATPPTPVLRADLELGFDQLNLLFLKELDTLEPFGPGNPEPVFISPPLLVRSSRIFGEKHLALDLRDEQARVSLKGKYWRQAESLGLSLTGRTIRVAYTPRLDSYNGLTSIDLTIKDLQEI